MANLIPTSKREAYKQAINNVHETFARDIVVWRSSAQEITSTDQEYDAFNDQRQTNIVYTTESKTFKARIKYIDKQDKEFGLNLANTNIDITQELQLVRIKVDLEANNYIKDCKKVTIDGQDFYTLTIPRPHGLFEPDYYTIYLTNRP